jgi:hypothetical protein
MFDRWIFWAKVPICMLSCGFDPVWAAIEELIVRENPEIGDMSSFRCWIENRLMDARLVDDQMVNPHHVSGHGIEVWACLRPYSLQAAA